MKKQRKPKAVLRIPLYQKDLISKCGYLEEFGSDELLAATKAVATAFDGDCQKACRFLDAMQMLLADSTFEELHETGDEHHVNNF